MSHQHVWAAASATVLCGRYSVPVVPHSVETSADRAKGYRLSLSLDCRFSPEAEVKGGGRTSVEEVLDGFQTDYECTCPKSERYRVVGQGGGRVCSSGKRCAR